MPAFPIIGWELTELVEILARSTDLAGSTKNKRDFEGRIKARILGLRNKLSIGGIFLLFFLFPIHVYLKGVAESQ